MNNLLRSSGQSKYSFSTKNNRPNHSNRKIDGFSTIHVKRDIGMSFLSVTHGRKWSQSMVFVSLHSLKDLTGSILCPTQHKKGKGKKCPPLFFTSRSESLDGVQVRYTLRPRVRSGSRRRSWPVKLYVDPVHTFRREGVGDHDDQGPSNLRLVSRDGPTGVSILTGEMFPVFFFLCVVWRLPPTWRPLSDHPGHWSLWVLSV